MKTAPIVDPLGAHWRGVGDPEADAVVEALRDQPAWPRHVFGRATNGAPPSGPTPLVALLSAHTRPDPSVRPDALARAAAWAGRHLPYLSLGMLCGSLPLLFLGAEGAGVLGRTGRLLTDVDRRVNRTGAYVLDVVAPGGMGSGGRALRASVEVRLAHALVRADAPRTPAEVAICQQDMLTTLFAFGVVPVRCTRRLGVPVDARDADDYYQLWRAVAPALGVDARLVPPTFRDAERLLDSLLERIAAPSEQGRALADALLDGMQRHFAVPGGRDAPAWLVRYLLGERRAAMLGIPEVAPARRPRWARALSSRAVRTVAPVLGRRVHAAIVAHKLG